LILLVINNVCYYSENWLEEGEYQWNFNKGGLFANKW